MPLRMLGGGFNLLVRDDPVPGVVMRLAHEPFATITLEGTTVRAAGGARLLSLIETTVRAGLGGLETLVGIRGTVGGSVRCNVGDRTGEIGSHVRRVAVLEHDGTEQIRGRDELTFGDHSSDIEEPVILWVEFELSRWPSEVLIQRMRRAWILRKGKEPLSFQSAVRMFRDPPGWLASQLIEKSQLVKYRMGGAEVSERNANYAVASPGTTARDILQLIEDVRQKVKLATGVSLDQELNVW
jgi:UDP-N-acetylmuramate dehydrogenase